MLVTSINDYSKEQQFQKLSAVRDTKMVKVRPGPSLYDCITLLVGNVTPLGNTRRPTATDL